MCEKAMKGIFQKFPHPIEQLIQLFKTNNRNTRKN